jgi:hypothetical protein
MGAGVLARIATTQSVENAGKTPTWLSSIEKMDAKRELYEALDAVCPARTVFTSNTSYLNIFEAMPAARLLRRSSPTGSPRHTLCLWSKWSRVPRPQATVDSVEMPKSEQIPKTLKKFVPGFASTVFSASSAGRSSSC